MADFSKLPFPKRLITMDMPDKYMALCFIYEGMQYQNLCRKENPDGSFNYSANCLAELPFLPPQYLAGSSGINTSSPQSGESGLVKYEPNLQAPMPPIKDILAHHWFSLAITTLFLLFFIHMASRFISNLRIKTERSKMTECSADGIITCGKISYERELKLGEGNRGTCVFKGCFEKTQKCAVKRIVIECANNADREVDTLRTLQHQNLVRYFASEKDVNFVYIALELAEYTLRYVIEKRKLLDVKLERKDICRQACSGLKYLHENNIVHRDIKPENILISFPKRPNNQRNVMISDFGLSKDLSNISTCHSASVMRYFDGTHGWTPPEIIKAKEDNTNLAPSKSADIFSLGCVLYYIIFNGKHPFGDVLEVRQRNILLEDDSIDEFRMMNFSGDTSDEISNLLIVMGNDLVRAMIKSDPMDRPPIEAVLNYPMFWSKRKQLNFLVEVSDHMDKDHELARSVERGRLKVIGYDWKQCLSQPLLDDLIGPATKHRSYNQTKLTDLLRVIRNKKNHYNDCSEALKQDIGDIPDKFLDYFTSRFPELLVHIYKAMQPHREEPKFREYYEYDGRYVF